jgi:hypothetical protein
MSNIEIASRLQDYARQLRKRRDNLYRVRAYRIASETVMRLDKTVEEILHERGRTALPTILLVENIGGYAEYLSGFQFSSEWSDLGSSLGVRFLSKGVLRNIS